MGVHAATATLLDWLRRFSDELNSLGERQALARSWFLDGKRWNRQSWLHSRIHGALVRSVDPPYVPLVEVKWHSGLRPDLCVVDARDNYIAVVEYQSTHSSDERLIGSNIERFEEEIASFPPDSSDLLTWWVLISTLPNEPVEHWPWWTNWSKNTRYPPRQKNKLRRNQNPREYFEDGLHDALAAAWESVVHRAPDTRCRLVWVNVTPDSIDLMNVDGEPCDPRASFRLSLPAMSASRWEPDQG